MARSGRSRVEHPFELIGPIGLSPTRLGDLPGSLEPPGKDPGQARPAEPVERGQVIAADPARPDQDKAMLGRRTRVRKRTSDRSGNGAGPWPESCHARPTRFQAERETLRDGRARIIAVAITTAIPIAIRMSPTLNTLARGMNRGRAKMSVSGSRAGWATTALFE